MFQYLVLTTQHIFCQPVINTSHLTLYRKIFAACSETIQNRQQHCLNRNNLQKTHQQNEDKCKIGRWVCPFRIGDLVLLEDHSLCQVVTRCRRNYCRGCVVSFQLNTFYTGIGYFGASHKSFSFFFLHQGLYLPIEDDRRIIIHVKVYMCYCFCIQSYVKFI